jgi:hypothetical protein
MIIELSPHSDDDFLRGLRQTAILMEINVRPVSGHCIIAVVFDRSFPHWMEACNKTDKD